MLPKTLQKWGRINVGLYIWSEENGLSDNWCLEEQQRGVCGDFEGP